MHNIFLEISISKTSNRCSLLAYQSSRYSSFCLIETSLTLTVLSTIYMIYTPFLQTDSNKLNIFYTTDFYHLELVRDNFFQSDDLLIYKFQCKKSLCKGSHNQTCFSILNLQHPCVLYHCCYTCWTAMFSIYKVKRLFYWV